MSDIEYDDTDVEGKLIFLLERNRLAVAEDVLRQALPKDPDNTFLLFCSAYIDNENGDHELAEKTLNDVLLIEPENSAVKSLLVEIYIVQERFCEAELLIIELIREFPESSDYYAEYANLMLFTLNLDKAFKLSREAIRLDPDNISALQTSLFCEIVQHDSKEAMEKIGDLVSKYPDTATTAISLTLVLMENCENRKALSIMQEVLRNDPSNEDYVDIIKELRFRTHPTMLPTLPMIKNGWHVSAVLWLTIVIIYHLSDKYLSSDTTLIIALSWLGYVIYTWVYPPILRKIMKV